MVSSFQGQSSHSFRSVSTVLSEIVVSFAVMEAYIEQKWEEAG